MKVLIVGSEGFIGHHLCNEFADNGYSVVRCDKRENAGVYKVDIMDINSVRGIVEKEKPDYIVNMAGQANVGLSWSKPQLTVELNTIGLINILEAVKAVDTKIRVVTVGSSDEYGNLEERGVNVTEETPINPITPYAISKQAQELFAQIYNKAYGMNVCMVRMFNLGGSGQMKGYLIADFASEIAEIEAGKRDYMSVGNLRSARDFTHVKDACTAVRLIAERGYANEIYNIASGNTYKVQEILEKLVGMAKVRIDIRQDMTRMRPSDTPVVRGNHDKLTNHTGWIPQRNIEEVLKDALEYWREQYNQDDKN